MRNLSRNFLSLVLLYSSLSAVAAEEINPADAWVQDANGANCTTLYAGQTTDVGAVCLSVFDGKLVVDYSTTGNWYIGEVHAWAGTSLAGMPQTNSGNPKVGNFPYQAGSIDQQSYQVEVSLDDLLDYAGKLYCEVDYLYAAHAVVYQVNSDGSVTAETAWSAGARMVSKGSWATYSTFQFGCEQPPVDPPADDGQHETAYAFGGVYATCFIDSGISSRWGWSNGPLSAAAGPVLESFPVYAGAGQCDLSKGTLVGYLDVLYDGQVLTVTYAALPGFHFDEIHLHAGNEPYLTDKNGGYTIANGQFGLVAENLNQATTLTYQLALSGEIYIIAHAVAGANP